MNNSVSSDYLNDRTTNLIVSSYIRKSEILLSYSLINYIPSDIKSITLSYVGKHFMYYRGSYQWQIQDPKTIQSISSSQFKITNIKWILNFSHGNINLNILSMASIRSYWDNISMRLSLQCHQMNKQLIENKELNRSNSSRVIMTLPLNNIRNTNVSQLTIVISVTILRVTGIKTTSDMTNMSHFLHRIHSKRSTRHSLKLGTRHTFYDQKYEIGKYWIEDLLIAATEPSLIDIKNIDERKTLFIKKLQLCCFMFDFNVDLDSNHQRAKELKRTYLIELVEYISKEYSNSKQRFSDDCIPQILELISTNIFRSLPPSNYQYFDSEQDEPNFDPSWPHLQFVYELFQAFLCNIDKRFVQRYIDKRFLLNILALFNSEDPRERDFLKLILHCIYGRIMPFRSFIRKAIRNIFYGVIYSNIQPNGISELLELCSSIITGFRVPLKNEHQLFFHNILIPMHKVLFLSQFHDELLECIFCFIQKDKSLVLSLIYGLLKFWPIMSSKKELLFLKELEQIFDLMNMQQIEMVMVPLFNRISQCICSMNLRVAENTLLLWNNDNVAVFTTEHRKQILPIIYPSLQKNLNHWSSSVLSLSLSIIGKFKEIDNKLYEKVDKYYKNTQKGYKHKM